MAFLCSWSVASLSERNDIFRSTPAQTNFRRLNSRSYNHYWFIRLLIITFKETIKMNNFLKQWNIISNDVRIWIFVAFQMFRYFHFNTYFQPLFAEILKNFQIYNIVCVYIENTPYNNNKIRHWPSKDQNKYNWMKNKTIVGVF